MFKQAVGWLGWPPDTALDTPLPLIELAMEGRIDCLISTNPFGAKKKEKLSEEEAAERLFAMLGA